MPNEDIDPNTEEFYLSHRFPRSVGGQHFSSKEDYIASLKAKKSDPKKDK